MKQLVSSASNLLVAVHDDKTGRRAIPMAEIVISSAESVYRLVNNQMVREPVVSDARFTIDLEGVRRLAAHLEDIESQLVKLGDHFNEDQAKLPL